MATRAPSNWTRARSRLALATRQHGPSAPETIDAKRDFAAAKIERMIRETVAAAPPLTAEQRRLLAGLLDPVRAEKPAKKIGGR